MKKTNKLLALLLVVVMIASMIPMASANNTKTFPDVKPTDWFYTDVMAMAEKGVIEGYNDGTYKPQAPVTYAEFSSLVSKAFYGTDLEKEVKGEGFVDVDMKPRLTTTKADQWWAYNIAVLGYNDLWTQSSMALVGNYEYDTVMDMNNMLDYDALWTSVQSVAEKPMSRQSVLAALGCMLDFISNDKVAMIAKYPILNSQNGAAAAMFNGIYDKYDGQYRDGLFSDWSFDDRESRQVAMLLETGIIQGNPNGTLNVKGSVTRAEMATIMNRLFNCEYLTADVYQAPTTTVPTTPTTPEVPTTPVVPTEPTTTTTPNTNAKGYYDNTKYVVPADFNNDSILTEEEVAQMIAQLEEEFPDGSPLADAIYPSDGYLAQGTGGIAWTPENDGIYYRSTVLGAGGNCIAWAYYASDRIFGNLPVTKLSIAEVGGGVVRVGDVIQSSNHTTIACENTWADEDGTYGCATSDSGAALKIFWSNTIGGASCITPFWFSSILTRYPQ